MEAEIIVERIGALGVLRLNRPKALNSLTLDMVRTLSSTLDDFAADPDIGLVLLEGAGERGLCAGGDIRALYNSAREKDGMAPSFFHDEYRLNSKISRYRKPYVAFMDGLVMGGGIGISAHGRHRIVTERTRFAMPETAIGFIPDVGGTWLLSHTPGEIGTYVGLCGETFEGADAIYAGIANAFVSSQSLPALREALAGLGAHATNEEVRATIDGFASVPQAGVLEDRRPIIDETMNGEHVEDILDALAKNGSDFALAAAKTLATRSPTSLKITLQLLRLGRQAPDLEACLINEYRIGLGLLGGHDFIEGVRAAVIDKDRNPRWSPSDLAHVENSIAPLLAPRAGEPNFPERG